MAVCKHGTLLALAAWPMPTLYDMHRQETDVQQMSTIKEQQVSHADQDGTCQSRMAALLD